MSSLRFTKLRYRNFASVGDYWIEIDLARHSSVLFFGKNGSGKSSCIDALCYVLYKKPFKKITLPSLINDITKKGLVVELEFSVGDHEYLVRRGMKPSVFEIFKNGNLIEQDAKGDDYQDFLENEVLKMNYKSFTQIVVLGIAYYVPFMRLKTPERRIVVEDLLDYQVFSLMNSLLSERAKLSKISLNNIENKINIINGKIEVNRLHMENKKSDDTKIITEKEAALADMEKQHAIQVKQLASLKEEIVSLQVTIEDEAEIQGKLNKINSIEQQLLGKIKDIKKEIGFYKDNDDCPTCRQSISKDFVSDRIKNRQDKIAEMTTAIQELDSKREPLRERMNEIQVIQSTMASLDSQWSHQSGNVGASRRHIYSLQNEIEQLKADQEADEYQDMTKELNSQKEALIADREEISAQVGVHSNAAILLKDTGIKARLIRSFIPKMNELINKFLVELDFFGNIEIDENFDAVIRARHCSELDYEALSRGQQLRVDLAFLFTWRVVAKLRSNIDVNLLVFDEIYDSSLDIEGIEELMKVLGGMLEGHNIFTISPKGEAIADKFEQSYEFRLAHNFTEMQEVA